MLAVWPAKHLPPNGLKVKILRNGRRPDRWILYLSPQRRKDWAKKLRNNGWGSRITDLQIMISFMDNLRQHLGLPASGPVSHAQAKAEFETRQAPRSCPATANQRRAAQ